MFGVIFSLQFLFYTIATTTVGYLSSKGFRSLEPLLLIALCVSALCLALIGHVPTFWALALVMMCIGTCGGLVEANGTTLLAHYDTSKGGKLVHLSQFFYSIGAFTAPLVIAFLLYQGQPITIIGYSTGGLTFVVFLVVFALLNHPTKTDKPREVQNESEEVRGFSWSFLLFLALMFLYVIVEISTVSWIPYYMEQRLSIPSANASIFLTAFWMGLGISRLIYTFINTHRLLLHIGLCIVGIIISLFFVQAGIFSYEFLLIFILLMGFSCGPIWPLLIELCKQTFHSKHHIMYLISAGSVGALVGPFLTSLIYRQVGIGSMLFILLSYTLLMGCSLLVLAAKLSRRERPSY